MTNCFIWTLIISQLVLWKISPVVGTFNPDGRDHRKIMPRIVGGHTCSIKQHPYLVSIQNKRFSPGHFCAGTLLSARWVLSAKQCFSLECKNLEKYRVIAGADIAYINYVSTKSKLINLHVQESPIAKCFVHPTLNVKADVALLLLKKAFRKTSHVDFVTLPSATANNDLINVCHNATIMGWGVQFPVDQAMKIVNPRENILPHDPFLQCSQISVISQDQCQDMSRYAILIQESLVCAYKKNVDICRGDAGGPLICDGVQYGIGSFGEGCALSKNPGVYTKVQYFLEYIKNITSSESQFKCETSDCKARGSFLRNNLVFGHTVSLAVGLYCF